MSNWREDLVPGTPVTRDADRAARQRVAPWLAQPQAIRAVFFDAGFTLIHPNPSVGGIVERICVREGVIAPADQVRTHLRQAEQRFFTGDHILRGTWADNAGIAHAWLAYFQELVTPFVPDGASETIRRCTRAILAEFDRHTAWQVFDDVVPTLAALQGRYTLGVISDWGIALGAILRDLGLNRYFDFLIVSATSRRAKPDPHLFEQALVRGNAIGDYTLYIGDSYVQDVLGARAVGMHPILIDRRHQLASALIDCLVIQQLTELPDLLALNGNSPMSIGK